MTDNAHDLTEEEQRCYVEALETLPSLTRVAFLLSCRDDLPYAEIAWRCGTSELDVRVRVGDALYYIGRYIDGRRRLVGSIRRELLPFRIAWAAARAREGDRRLAPWLSRERRPGRRGLLDWIAWGFERLTR
ncbi:MAG: sigma-70 region 4 domain-containing protein [Sphingomonas sp.]